MTIGDDNIWTLESNLLRDKLKGIYGESVICRVGKGKPTYNMTYIKDKGCANLAVYINKKYGLALVWNLEHRRNNNRVIKSLSVNRNWDKLLKDEDALRAIYKEMHSSNKRDIPKDVLYEKVLALSINTLDKIAYDLYLYMNINEDDTEYVDQCGNYIPLPKPVGKRVSTTRFERDRNFRNRILFEYNNKCAICRCAEKKILEAAHIQGIADGGQNDTSNGICLCANHHLMYDTHLIKINFENQTLEYVAPSVQSMPWYYEFIHQYSGKLLAPKSK